jgi:hypothetical protein
MRFAKQVNGESVRFCRIKRMGTKNCRVVWLDNNEEQLVPVTAVAECPAVEANGDGALPEAGTEAVVGVSTETPYPTQISGDELCRMMRNYQVSAKELAVRLGIPTDQVREARSTGLNDPKLTLKWITAIQLQPEAASA